MEAAATMEAAGTITAVVGTVVAVGIMEAVGTMEEEEMGIESTAVAQCIVLSSPPPAAHRDLLCNFAPGAEPAPELQ